MITDTYVFELDFQDGQGWRDVTADVDITTIQRTRSIHNGLRPTINTLQFNLGASATIVNLMMTTTKGILFRAEKNSADYFAGVVRNTYRASITTRLDVVPVEVLDNLVLLQKKIIDSVTYVSNKVSDTTTTSNSIVHKLLTLAGYTSGMINVTDVDKTVDYFVIEARKRTYLDVLASLFFEYGYSVYCDESGRFCIYNWRPTSITTTDKFQNTAAAKNILGSISWERRPEEYDGVEVTYWPTVQMSEAVPVFSEQEGADTFTAKARKWNCAVPVEDGDFYPPGADTTDVYVDYGINEKQLEKSSGAVVEVGIYHMLDTKKRKQPPIDAAAQSWEGYEIVCVPDPITSIVNVYEPFNTDVTYSLTVTNYYTRALVSMEISASGTFPDDGKITKFQLLGKPVMRGTTMKSECLRAVDSEKILSFKSAYITVKADADTLAMSLDQYYQYADIVYTLQSITAYEPGAYVYIDEDDFIGINNLVRIVSRIDNEYTGEMTYLCEGAAAYAVTSVTATAVRRQPPPILPAVVETVVDKAPQIQFISSSGSTTYEAPGEGDLSSIYEDGVQNYYEYTGGAWVQTTAIKIGALIAAAFIGLIACAAIVNPQVIDDGEITSGEWLPNHAYSVFDMENNFEDQHGVDIWTTKTNTAFDSTIKKFGTYSFTGTSGNTGSLQTSAGGATHQYQTFGAWFRVSVSNAVDGDEKHTVVGGYEGTAVVDRIVCGYYKEAFSETLKAFWLVKKNSLSTEQIFYSTLEITNDEFVFVGFAYDAVNDDLYCIINDEVTINNLTIVGEDWGSSNLYLHVKAPNGVTHDGVTYTVHVDDVLFCFNKYAPINVLIQHYNHGLPWNADYAKDDVTLIPAATGRVFSKSPIVSSLGIEGPMAIFEDQKSKNTSGGTFTSGADRVRALNATVVNTITGCSLASNRVTVPAGKYYFRWACPALACGRHQSLLYDYTNSAELARGSSSLSSSSSAGSTILDIAAETAIELRHRCETTRATDGFGIECDFSTEVFSRLEIIKLG